MKETEYLKAGNLAKLRTIGFILKDIVEGDLYGVSNENYTEAVKLNEKMAGVLYGQINLKEG